MSAAPLWIAPEFSNIPAEMRAIDRWVTWNSEHGKNGGKPRKVPKCANGRRGSASSTDPATWGTFAQAQAAYTAGGLSGIGFVLNGDGLVGVDLDHCVIDGVPSAQAISLLDRLGAGYIEVSPSGTGLRALGYGESLDSGANGVQDGLRAEFYSTGRYLTLTGKTIKAGPITKLRDFKSTADSFRATKAAKVNQETGQIENVSGGEKQQAWIKSLLAGDVYHDSLRDLAASWVSQGMIPAAAIAALESLMDNAVQREEWQARRDQIPDLVNSAYAKYHVRDFSDQLEDVTAEPKRYKLLSSADLAALPPLSWRVRGVLPAVGLAGLYGPSGSGKSFLALDMAAAISEGSRWFCRKTVAAPVVYCALEGEGGFKLRVQAWETKNCRVLPADLRLILQSVTLTAPQDVKDLASVVPSGAVVFLDTLNRAAPIADENSSKDMGQILQSAKALQTLIGGLVVLVHHTGKDATKGLRGHSSLFAALDAAVEVSRDGDSRKWHLAKSKDGSDGDMHGFCLDVVSMGIDDDGEDIASCVVLPADTFDIRTKPLTPSQRLGMDSLTAALTADLFGSSVHRDAWRESFYARHTAEKQGAKQKAFIRVTGDLLAMGCVTEAGGLFSIPDF